MTKHEAIDHLASAIDHVISLEDDGMNLATIAAGEGASEFLVGARWGAVQAALTAARLELYKLRKDLERADVRSA
jgi:hypothetical protein